MEVNYTDYHSKINQNNVSKTMNIYEIVGLSGISKSVC